MTALRQGIGRVLKMRLADQATTRDQLADQQAQATGLPPAQVAALAARLRARYDTLLAAIIGPLAVAIVARRRESARMVW